MAKAKKSVKKVGGNKKNMKAMKVGAGVAAGVAAALAGAYLLYHKSSPAQRRKAKTWMMKVRKDVAGQVKKLKQVSAVEYGRIIDKAIKRSASLKNATAPELLAAAQEMKAEWKHIQAEAGRAVGMSVKKKAMPKKKATSKKRSK